jgi:hypothetical protein
MGRSAGNGTEVDAFEEECGEYLHGTKIRA